jgi:broad specificity phosphatase PhoE
MTIGVIRHALVLHRDPFWTTPLSFEKSRAEYDHARIKEAEEAIDNYRFPVCFVSTKWRAIQTAEMLRPGQYIITNELDEVPTKSFFKWNMVMPTFLRSVAGRLAWIANNHAFPETRKQSNERAGRFIDRLLKETGENTLLITHGIFMQSLRYALEHHGFHGHLPLFPENLKLYVFESKTNSSV